MHWCIPSFSKQGVFRRMLLRMKNLVPTPHLSRSKVFKLWNTGRIAEFLPLLMPDENSLGV
jgi:hypothetical protein